ncbi:hypothetical protein L7F22_034735 [Adiantum nelumboides]|nr:hypothetical protein [Adiantum nelumboides]
MLIICMRYLACAGSANVETITGMPGVPSIPVWTYPWMSGEPTQRQETFEVLASVKGYVEQLDAVIFNSFTELEKETIDALTEQGNLKTKMLPIGPTLLLNNSSTDSVDGGAAGRANLSPQDKECLDWLDTKRKGSVLYAAFGTTAWLGKNELHALALGIEASRVTFLWVLRTDLLVGESDVCFPEGFIERTKGSAHFTSWAPQPLVLSHPSIGGFMTHGGWNSALEAICNGVPMLMWPDFWDQKMHSEQVVSEWKVGLPLKSDDPGQVVEPGEVEEMVRRIMQHGAGPGEQLDPAAEGQVIRGRMEAWKSFESSRHVW